MFAKSDRFQSHLRVLNLCVNKEFRQQFQNYAPPSLRVIRTRLHVLYVTGSRKRDHFADLLESRYRRLNSDNNNKTFFADLSFLLANGSRIFPLPLYQILSFVLFSK